MDLNINTMQEEKMNMSKEEWEKRNEMLKIKAIKESYGKEHFPNKVIFLPNDDIVVGWYLEEAGETLEDVMRFAGITNDEELLVIYSDWVDNFPVPDIKLEAQIN